MRFASLALLVLALPISAQTTYTWAGGTGGSWEASANWIPTGVPSPGDTAVISGGHAVLSDSVSVARLTLDTDPATGGLGGTGALSITDSLAWDRGGVLDTLRLRVEAGAHGSLGADSDFRLDGTVVNAGTMTWTGESEVASPAGTGLVINTGTFISAGAATRNLRASFHNDGLLVHMEGDARIGIGAMMTSPGEVRSLGGHLQLGPQPPGPPETGRFVTAGGAVVAFDAPRHLGPEVELVGDGTIGYTGSGSQYQDESTWRIGGLDGSGIGTLNVNSFGPGPVNSGVLEVDLGGMGGPGVGHDQAVVEAHGGFTGTIRVRLVGGFVPVNGDRFRIVRCGQANRCTLDVSVLELPDGVEASLEGAPESLALDLVITTPVANEEAPDRTLALSVAPNPTRGTSRLVYALAEAAEVRLALHDALGREVALLVDGPRAAGEHEEALDVSGLPAGVYLLRLTTEAGALTRPLTVAR